MRVVVQVGRERVPNPIHRHVTEALEALEDPDLDWASVSDHWLELSLAVKGTAWETAVECFGEALLMRDAEALGRGLTALKRKFD